MINICSCNNNEYLDRWVAHLETEVEHYLIPELTKLAISYILPSEAIQAIKEQFPPIEHAKWLLDFFHVDYQEIVQTLWGLPRLSSFCDWAPRPCISPYALTSSVWLKPSREKRKVSVVIILRGHYFGEKGFGSLSLGNRSPHPSLEESFHYPHHSHSTDFNFDCSTLAQKVQTLAQEGNWELFNFASTL